MLSKIKKTALWKKLSCIYIFKRDIKEIKQTIKQFNRKCSYSLVKDMIIERRYYNVPYREYFLFQFDCVDKERRRSFVTDVERVQIASSLNLPENDHIFYDKGITYEIFGKFYYRDVLIIKSHEDKKSFLEFISKHQSFICKPTDGGCGKGIRIVNVLDEESEESLFEKLISDYEGKCIIEELIVQAEEMKALHPHSVNTVRVPSIRFDDRVEIIHPFLRVGKGGKITDNAGSGGIICAIDYISGMVTAAADEFGNTYDVHPDTKEALIGFKVPRWDEAVELVKDLAQIVPDNRYCSWDLALTENGWSMVEVNAKGQFIWQYATKNGFRNEINNILQELKQ